jgi:hypothetical protein
MGELVQFQQYTVVRFSWGSAIHDRRGKWITAFFPDEQELDLEPFEVILHDNGIEFLEGT